MKNVNYILVILLPFFLLFDAKAESNIDKYLNQDSLIVASANALGIELKEYIALSNYVLSAKDGHSIVEPKLNLQDEPVVIDIMELSRSGKPIPSYLVREYKKVILKRTDELAAALSVPAETVFVNTNKIADFDEVVRVLVKAENERGLNASVKDDDEEPEYIEIRGTRERIDGAGSTELSLAIQHLASSSGIRQYQSFTVIFVGYSGSETSQTWRYNNFSGAWSIDTPVSCEGGICAPTPN